MKREGRQHGFVTCYDAPPPELSPRRVLNRVVVDSAVVGDQFIKASNKPTNLSKFTGRCLHPYKGCKCCHITPAYKSKHKTKGTMKLRSMDSGKKLTKDYSGTSVTGVLAYLAHENGYDDDDDDGGGYGYAYDDQ